MLYLFVIEKKETGMFHNVSQEKEIGGKNGVI